MPRSRTLKVTSPFGKWLDIQMRQGNFQQKQVASRSGLGQSTIAGYLTGARKPNSADTVHRIVQGILPDNTADDAAAQVLRGGLLAAGFAADPLPPAAALIREVLAGREGDVDLTPEQFDTLIDDIEAYANMRLSRTVRQTQGTK